MKKNKISGFKKFITEKGNKEALKKNFDDLIKELERLNSRDNKYVKHAIEMLKKGRDENIQETIKHLNKLTVLMKESPEQAVKILSDYGSGIKKSISESLEGLEEA